MPEPILGGWREGTWDEESQAEFGEFFYRKSFGHRAVQCIVWFGLSDADVVYPKGGVLDEGCRAKKVYHVLNRLIHQEWTTQITGRLQADGPFSFRGFYGRYDVRVCTSSAKEFSFHIHLKRDQPNSRMLKLGAP